MNRQDMLSLKRAIITVLVTLIMIIFIVTYSDINTDVMMLLMILQEEVTALRGDVAHLFLALKAAEARHQQELAGVIIDAAHHQTKASSCCSQINKPAYTLADPA